MTVTAAKKRNNEIYADPSKAVVTITGPDGKVYTDPSQIKITREDFPELYRLMENYKPKPNEKTG
ncbi:MAG: hypothetical protein QM657_10720 [Lacrimispora sp.]|uniref:hypothetical protein n=1 Tax=Lacrimispora sp. TaxID=2719234 RepID=UPI0039E6CCB0